MERRTTSWFSPNLQMEMPLVAYGQAGQTLLMLPTILRARSGKTCRASGSPDLLVLPRVTWRLCRTPAARKLFPG